MPEQRRYLLTLFMLAITLSAWAQQTEHAPAQTDVEKPKNLKQFLEGGKFELHMRSYFMSTINQGSLTDYSTLATGAGIGYYSPTYKNFRIGLSGFFILRVFEHNLEKIDLTTGAANRYEIALYDTHHPENGIDLDRLEELFIEYKKNRWQFTLGRQKIHSPFLNEQDNRMRPNLFSGLTGHYRAGNWEATGSWLTGVTPRGTIDWYSIEESFGVYSSGKHTDGSPAAYQGHISSKGIGLAGLSYEKGALKTQAWNYMAANVFNLFMLQADYHTQKNTINLIAGAQGFYESALKQGGNPEPAQSYILPGESTYGIGMSVGGQIKTHRLTFNYLGISKQGRFLFPREWGREIFYVSLPRERFEGQGGVQAYTIKYTYTMPDPKLQTQLGISKVVSPAVDDFSLNKYGIPSYYHLSGMVDYKPEGNLKGLAIKLLAVHKLAAQPNPIPDQVVMNRVNMWNLNIIMDYKF
jgi:hypothetical protein